MKKYLYISILIISACTHPKSRDERAKLLITTYLDSVLNDPKSYEAIKFSKMDTVWSSPKKEPQYISIDASIDSLKKLIDALDISLIYHSSDPALYKQKGDLLNQELKLTYKKQAFVKSYKYKQIGWQMLHTYRAKNGFGALTMHDTYFGIDTAFTKVIGSEEK